ncbi:MAG: hypothetical protein REI11_09965 [Patulibacter sp.]|nr:hypothetical protein [Patulibacter sp.]
MTDAPASLADVDRCREELVAWLDAHTHWPMSAHLETAAGDLVAAMRGRLVDDGAGYAIVAADGALRFHVPAVVCGVRLNGARSAQFTRTDLVATIALEVQSP